MYRPIGTFILIPMDYKIKTEVEQGYIKIVASGKQTLEDNIQLVRLIVETAKEHNVDKIVVDIRGLWGQPGMTADFKLANVAVNEALGGHIKKTAIISNAEAFSYTAFFETAIRNRGINLFAFQNEAEAIEWISQG